MAYANTTNAQLRTRIREHLFNTFWVDAELDAFIIEALRVWNTLTGYFRSRVAVSLTANQKSYTIATEATNGMIMLRLVINSSPLLELGAEELGQFIPTYHDSTGTPIGWLPLGLSKFALYPTPSGIASGFAEVVTLAPLPPGDNDYIQVGEEDMDAIVSYCRFLAAIKEGGEELKGVMPLLKNFLSQAAKYNAKLLKSAPFRAALGLAAGGQPEISPDSLDKKAPR